MLQNRRKLMMKPSPSYINFSPLSGLDFSFTFLYTGCFFSLLVFNTLLLNNLLVQPTNEHARQTAQRGRRTTSRPTLDLELIPRGYRKTTLRALFGASVKRIKIPVRAAECAPIPRGGTVPSLNKALWSSGRSPACQKE